MHEAAETHRILIVDDQPTMIEWLRLVFAEQSDFTITLCSDALRSADLASSFRPTLILQDLIMPGRHGLEILADYRARAELADVPVIVLSSIEDVDEKARAFALGVAD